MIGDRWGITPCETARHYPCDDVVPDPVFQLWRGVTVHARKEDVWPWVAQIRVAPYSYDWIDNLGRASPQRLLALPEPIVGEPFSSALGGRPVGRIVAVRAGHELTGRILNVVLSYVLVSGACATRLLLKVVGERGRLAAPFLSVGDLVMARRQLLNIASLSEGVTSAVTPMHPTPPRRAA